MANKDKANSSIAQYNRLIYEKSPYLLQHATNPVDWFPWGTEAFEKAKSEDKPIFLSIGYSTCHWCHVMERESFEDDAVARLLNDFFISIKVDREERPDIDNIYMAVCQLITGSGGWPLSIILAPDKRPFFAATYIPRSSRNGQVGMIELLPRISELWKNKRDDIMHSAQQIIQAISQESAKSSYGGLTESIFRSAYEQFEDKFDERFGGFGRAPKFPTPHIMLFLLRYWKRSDDTHALEIVEKTLQAMRLGGIYDHLGFGFHRYSTDPMWLLPHFEKMLYDQALLAMAYTEAFQATQKEIYRDSAHEIFEYVLRDMTAPTGAFYSAEDADSEGEEGRFYLWGEREIRRILSLEDAELIKTVFNIRPEGNFNEQVDKKKTGANILHMVKPSPELADNMMIGRENLKKRLENSRHKLFEARAKRPHPYKDDKILTDWNGLMIAALALGSQAFDEPRYAEAAKRATDFIMENMRTPDGRLFHRYRDGQMAIPGNLDDYSFLILGLINLYEATFDVRYLKSAFELNSVALKHFWDGKGGAFHFTADDSEELPIRTKEVYNGAVPSGNSVAALNLIKLGRISGNLEYEAKAGKIFDTFSCQLKSAPQSFTMLLVAFDFAIGPSYEVVIAGRPKEQDTLKMITALRQKFIPNKVVIFKPEGDDSHEIAEIAEFTKNQKIMEGMATAFVCRNYACKFPTTDIGKMLELLNSDNSNVPQQKADK